MFFRCFTYLCFNADVISAFFQFFRKIPKLCIARCGLCTVTLAGACGAPRRRVLILVSGKYSCKNPKCPMVIASAQKEAKADVKALVEIDWKNEGTGKLYCKDGVSFNTMDERYRGSRFVE